MSSGFGTQHNDSRDEPTYGESIELRMLYAANSTDTAPETPVIQKFDSTDDQDIEAYLQYQKSLLNRSPSYRKSIDRISLLSSHTEPLPEYNTYAVNKSHQHSSPQLPKQDLKRNESPGSEAAVSVKGHRHTGSVDSAIQIGRLNYKLSQLPSNQSINTLSNDQEELFTQSNLRDELLNCDQKELFQFLSDDFDSSNNYFSETVGFGNALMNDSETNSVVFDSKKETPPPRKTSSSSMKSNFSYISNSIFTTLEQKRGGSISESIDRMLTRSDSMKRICTSTDSVADDDDHEPLVNDSEFENIIVSFERELNEIKKSTSSLHRRSSVNSRSSSDTNNCNSSSCIEKHDNKASIYQNIHSPQAESSSSSVQLQLHSSVIKPKYQPYQEQNVVLPRRTFASTNNNVINNKNRESIKIKRRSLEKQNKVDDGFSVSNEMRKNCDHIQAPFIDVNNIIATSTITSTSGSTALITKSNTASPNLRRKTSDFHSSFDRIKRTSLIERVDESLEDPNHPYHQYNAQQSILLSPIQHPTKTVSEKLPRKYLGANYTLDSISLKSIGSYENLVTHREKHQNQLQPQESEETNNNNKNDINLTLKKSIEAKKEVVKSSDDGKFSYSINDWCCTTFSCIYVHLSVLTLNVNIKIYINIFF